MQSSTLSYNSHSSFVTCNFSAFHASCTVCNVNFSQLIQIINSCSLLPLPHFNQKRSALGRQFRVYRMLSQKFSQIYLCRNFNQLLETALNCNFPKPKFLFLFRSVSEVLFIFFFFCSIPCHCSSPFLHSVPIFKDKIFYF